MASPLTHKSGDALPTYEPVDLDNMTRPQALDAVLADIRAHQVDAGPDGFFTALRHIDLLGHLALRFTADAHHTLAGDSEATNAAQAAQASGQAAATVGRALTHYTQALLALTKVSAPDNQASFSAKLESVPHHTALRRHLHAAHQALDEARTALAGATPQGRGHITAPVARRPAASAFPRGHGL
ncbi:hypothetical protein [Streptomyces celluloflavus]|uniref:hypothetical protein n=1 Tax=Streptomyces celluloflavus TaxID=58344 RepID=UPI00345FD124|nr:hypothetical protein OG717_29685 [Streptomyces celluloflavus]